MQTKRASGVIRLVRLVCWRLGRLILLRSNVGRTGYGHVRIQREGVKAARIAGRRKILGIAVSAFIYNGRKVTQMRISKAIKQCFVGLVLVLSACVAMAQQAKPVDNNALRNAAKDADEWLTHGRDYSETYYSPLDQINASNVSRLGLAWWYDAGNEPGTIESTPIVSNGTIYATGTYSVVFALDARTGKLKWRWDPQIPHPNFPAGSVGKPDKVRTGPSICCGPANRGVAVYDGKVYVGVLDTRLVALDAETGKIVWEVKTADVNSDYSVTGAPRIVKGMVIIGNASGEYATRGYVTAYDAETGKQIWRWYTVPGDPSKPFENKAMERAAKTWTGEWWKLGGGGDVWDSMSYDPETDLLYIGVGQGGPWVRNLRSPKGGDNLYICSIVALKASTGEYVWHFQTTPGDEWDYDATQGMILADLKINGKMRKVLMQAPKNGFFYVLDRKTGQFISGKPYVNVTWTSGLDPKTGRPAYLPEMHYGDNGKVVTVAPGPAGGHAWTSMSFNPTTKLAYVAALNSTFRYQQDENFKPEVGVYDWGISFKFPTPTPGQQNTAPPPTSGGFLLAWDPVTQAARWEVPNWNGGGTVTTAGNLVFAASNIGDFGAFGADKGEKLWSVRLVPQFANPITYMVDGKQYVSVMAGRGGHSRLYTFALDAHMPIPGSPYAAPRNAAPAPEATHKPNQP